MARTDVLQLSVGDAIPDRRFSNTAHQGLARMLGKPVQFRISDAAVRVLSDSGSRILAELELYFSCLVRKQVRFREMTAAESEDEQYTHVIPGLFASFRAVCTQHCRIADVSGKAPLETLPVKKPDLFVPDWVKVDFKAGKWLGEYGFERNI